MECKNCLLDRDTGLFDKDGNCDFCRNYWEKWENRDYVAREIELRKMFAHFKEIYRGRKYYCIVPVSGGKDSVYVLYCARKRFDMRPLAVTYDNGFQTELARQNIRNVVEKLGVDHITIAPDKQELRQLYRAMFLKTKNICTVCNHAINSAIVTAARDHDTALILTGGVGKLEQAPIYGGKRYCMENVFCRICKESSLGFSIAPYCNKQTRNEFPVVPITLFNYVNYDYRTVLRTLQSELCWQLAEHGDMKIDCMHYATISYLKYLQNGITSAQLVASALLRDHQISREECRRRIEKEKQRLAAMDQEKVQAFLRFLDVPPDHCAKKVHILDYYSPMLTREDYLRMSIIKDEKRLSAYEKIQEIFRIIRMEVIGDGGHLKLVSITGNTVTIEILGDCRGCLQVDDTLIPHIEATFKNALEGTGINHVTVEQKYDFLKENASLIIAEQIGNMFSS